MSQCGKKDSCAGYDTPGSKCGFVKSSAFAPVSLNLMGMYLVKEHMNAHYRRLYSVKAAVDTKAPHSLQTKQNNSKLGGGMRSTSRTSSRTGFAKPVISQSILKDAPERNMNLADKIDRYLESVQKEYPRVPEGIQDRPLRPSSSTSRELRRIKASQKTQYSSSKHSRRFHASSDLLERHKDYFTKPTEPFVPRTLIRQGKSRLIGSRLYHPPVHRSSSQTSINHQVEHSEFSLNSRTRQLALASGRANKMVPALNIQRDMDHVRWLEEQARKVKAEQKLDELDQLLDYDDNYDLEATHSDRGDLDYHTFNRHQYSHPQVRFEHPHTKTGITIVKERASEQSPSVNQFHHHHQNNYLKKNDQVLTESPKFSQVRKQLEAKEEELRYLEFIRDVTNDILLRSIYTDQGLKQIFFCHMNRRSDLNQIKMKKLLEKLQEELGISKTDCYSWLDMAENNFDDQAVDLDENIQSLVAINSIKPNGGKFPKDENSNHIYQENKMIDHISDKSLQKSVMFSERIADISDELNNISSHAYIHEETSHNSLHVKTPASLVTSRAQKFEFDWDRNGTVSPKEKPKLGKNDHILYTDEPERDTNSICKSDKLSENHFVIDKNQNQTNIFEQEVEGHLDFSSQQIEKVSTRITNESVQSEHSERVIHSLKKIVQSPTHGEVTHIQDVESEMTSDEDDEINTRSSQDDEIISRSSEDQNKIIIQSSEEDDEIITGATFGDYNQKRSQKLPSEDYEKSPESIDNITESIMDILQENDNELANETESVISEEIGEPYMDDFEESENDL